MRRGEGTLGAVFLGGVPRWRVHRLLPGERRAGRVGSWGLGAHGHFLPFPVKQEDVSSTRCTGG